MDDLFEEQKQKFKEALRQAQSVVVSTGAGVSAESGVPTFRGKDGLWRKYNVMELATPEAFERNPSLVWEFYNYRRELMFSKQPNPGHITLAKLEEYLTSQSKEFTLITQNIDGLHKRAGSKNILAVHGDLYGVKCTRCDYKAENKDVPITPAFEGLGSPDPDTPEANVSFDDLPKCPKCNALIRPDVVWFGESLDSEILSKVDMAIAKADFMLVVGTSMLVYPAAAFPYAAKQTGAKLAFVNFEQTGNENIFDFVFIGKSGEILPEILNIYED